MKKSRMSRFVGVAFALFASVVILQVVTGVAAATDSQSFVITGSSTLGNILSRTKRYASRSPMKSLRVTSVVVSRFARVTFASKMENNEDVAKEMVFSVRLPEAAFISEFDMTVGGVTFIGKVKDKDTAKKQYKDAIESGNSAGLVVADVRETQTFDVSANVPARSSVEFHLVYQQLLKRTLGQYEHAITVSLRELVEEFVVDVYITETTGITSLSTESPRGGSGIRGKLQSGEGSDGVVEVETDVRRSKNQAKVTFKPTPTEQRRFLMLPEDKQKFIVRYDVTRDVLGGEIQTRNGYFVHFFAPENLPILPKKVIFVIDRSGSMQGRKIEQTKVAFTSIIKELRDSDKFNIVSFAGEATAWKTVESGVVDVTKRSISAAISYVNNIRATGGTNVNEAVLKAADLLGTSSRDDHASSMIILLTDGMPTAGITNTGQIRLNAKKAISGRLSLFCLGFGEDLNHDFLKRLASENDGIARKIYEDSDADLQLKGFFQEVATPLLLNVKMIYRGVNVTDLSRTNFDKYFKGSEEVIVGSYETDKPDARIRSMIKGVSREGQVVYRVRSTEIDDAFQHWYRDTGKFDDFIERLWAYVTIRRLLEKRTLSENKIEIQDITERVMALAMKYNFVTPLTSLVVTLPEDEMSTTAGPTIYPPIPPCYARGRSPVYPIRPPIWCPIILDPIMSVSPRRGGGRRSRNPGSSAKSGPRNRWGSRSISGARSGSASRSLSLSFSSLLGVPTATRVPYTREIATTTPKMPVSPKCSGTHRAQSGRMQLPANTQSLPAIQCTWKIDLARGKWIDFYIETANTSTNEVIIKSDGKTIFEHHGGVSDPKFISVMKNTAEVSFAVYKDDNVRPGIVIYYQEFVPQKTKSESPSSVPTLDWSLANCGGNISSSANLGGIISSPRYPKTYPENTFCLWSLINSDATNNRLRLVFLDIDIEGTESKGCEHDKLIIAHGTKERVLCGHEKTAAVVSLDEVTKIGFWSDGVLGGAGFKLRYSFAPKGRP